MSNQCRDLLERTKSFAIQALRLCADLPAGAETGLVKRQLARAATSVGANYRSARRAKSRGDFIAKLSIVEEEADECLYWLDLLQTLGVSPSAGLQSLSKEAGYFAGLEDPTLCRERTPCFDSVPALAGVVARGTARRQ